MVSFLSVCHDNRIFIKYELSQLYIFRVEDLFCKCLLTLTIVVTWSFQSIHHGIMNCTHVWSICLCMCDLFGLALWHFRVDYVILSTLVQTNENIN